MEQLVDEVVEPIGLLADPRQGRLAIGAGPGQLDGEPQAGQGGAQLVRDVLEQPALGDQEGGDLVGHPVEGLGHLADLIATREVISDAQVAPAEFLDGAPQAAERRRQVDRQQVAEGPHEQRQPEEIGQRFGMPRSGSGPAGR